jgi:hypothetical protein
MKTFFAALLVLAAHNANAWPWEPSKYSAGRTWGTVVDADTNAPVAGALVIALWDLEGGMERSRVGTFKVLEAVTDSMGAFSLPGWGPEPISPRGQLDAFDPALIVFRPGYTPERQLNGPAGERGKRRHVEVHDWLSNGTAIKIKKYSGSPGGYLQRMNIVMVQLGDVFYDSTGCRWKELPKTIRMLEEEQAREIAQGLQPQMPISADYLIKRKNCAPLDEFMKVYSAGKS